MKYQAQSQFDPRTWLLLNGLIWVGVTGAAWNLLKAGGWLTRVIDFIVRNQTSSFYCLAIGVLGLLAGKIWLDDIGPRAIHNLLAATWAFTGTFFILSLLPPL
jgi:hypothetical protein